MPSSKHLLIVVLLAIVGLLHTDPVGAQDKPSAKVNGEIITEAALVDELMTRHGYPVLEAMIEALAIRQQARERGLSVTPDELEARYQQVQREIIASAPASQLSEAQVFAVWLNQRNLNPETFREEIDLQLLLEAMVKGDVKVTEQEVAQFYESHPKELERSEAVRVSHITVTTQEEAEQIRQEIMAQKITFADAAEKYSIDPYGRTNAGLLPLIGQGELPNPAWEPIREQAFKLKADGEISPVFQTPMGWDILRREAHQKGGTPPFEEIQEELTEGIYRARLAQASAEMRSAIIKMARVEWLIEFPSGSEATAEAAPGG